MNRLPVAASRQSAADCCSHELRRSTETPLRQGSWSQMRSEFWDWRLPVNNELNVFRETAGDFRDDVALEE